MRQRSSYPKPFKTQVVQECLQPGAPLVVICGASAGVGRATAHRFAAAGYSIGLLVRDEKGLASTQDELNRYGVQVLSISVDVADASAVEAAAIRLEAALGPLIIWDNSAMATVFAPVEKLTAQEIHASPK